MPKVSVLMAAYNAEKYISDAISSILQQTFTDFEFIIINDGSTDRTEEIILSFNDDRIIYERNVENLGLTKTKYRLIEKAVGEIFIIMDADDISLPQRIELQIKEFDKNPKLGLCGTWAYIIDEVGNKTGKIKVKEKNDELKSSLLFWNRFIHPSVAIKSDVFKIANYNEKVGSAEDLDLWIRISQYFEVINIQSYLLLYRIHNDQITTAKAFKVNNDKNMALLDAGKQFFPKSFEPSLHIKLIDWTVDFNRAEFPNLLNYAKNLIIENGTFKVYDFKRTIIGRLRKRILRTKGFTISDGTNYLIFLIKLGRINLIFDILLVLYKSIFNGIPKNIKK
ncbi:MAG: glycosyltransferase [Chitinophagales bacterium]|nr:glycosyltransferase [Chitinophagales bacterium]